MALDPSYAFYADGTITLTNGSDIATGDLVAWDAAVLPFDFVFPNDGTAGLGVIKEVLAANQIRLAKPWTGPTLTNVPYTMVRWVRHTDPRVYALRVSDYLARLKGIPENIEEVAQEIHSDRIAIETAMTTFAVVEAAVEADRQAVDTAAAQVAADRQAAAESAEEAEQWAQAASSMVIPDNGVSNAKLADMAAGTVKMRRAGTGAGDPIDATLVELLADLGLAGAWTQESIGAAAAQGSLGSAAGTRAYLKMGRTVFISFDLTIVSNGTGAVAIQLPLPFSAARHTTFVGRERGLTGAALTGQIGTGDTSVAFFTSSNGYPGGTGARIVAAGVFEATT